MVNLTNLTITTFLAIAVVTTLGLLLSKVNRPFRSLAMLMTALLLLSTTSLPALATPHLAALGASDSALNQQQKNLEEDSLKLNPGLGQYSGVEDVPERLFSGQPLSDSEIERKIKSEITDDLVIDIKNGEVLLSGRVEDKETAQNIVEQVKEIPGVRQITFELGLEEIAS